MTTFVSIQHIHAEQFLHDKCLAFSPPPEILPSLPIDITSCIFPLCFLVLDFIMALLSSSHSATDFIRKGVGGWEAWCTGFSTFSAHYLMTYDWGKDEVYAQALYSKSLEHSMCSALKYWWVSKNTRRPVTFGSAEADGSHKEEGWCLLFFPLFSGPEPF